MSDVFSFTVCFLFINFVEICNDHQEWWLTLTEILDDIINQLWWVFMFWW